MAKPLTVHYLKDYKVTFDLELRAAGFHGLAWVRDVIDALERQSALRVEELRFAPRGARVTALVDRDATEAEVLAAIATIRGELLDRRCTLPRPGEVVGVIGPEGPSVSA